MRSTRSGLDEEVNIMRIVIVYESLFGSTRAVAEAIAQGVREAQQDTDVRCLPVAEADSDLVLSADLLVVGGPTHMRGMTSGLSRKMGLKSEAQQAGAEGSNHPFHQEPGAEGPGLRNWFHALPSATGKRVAAAFDTRADLRMAGGAAKGIAHRLRSHGYELLMDPEGFIVEDTEGPLRVGELDRAKAWGAGLVVQPH
jgi:hypothetical protein